ncbi:MAG: putative PEP-binding protein [Alistipes sp.]
MGLFRSEFLYMQSRGGFPDEQTQFEAYRHAAELCGERPLVIRTLDIGGDKALPYMDFGHEENPFLGWRAIRVSLSMQDVFRTQLRALLRASVFGNLRIMFPMITSVGEFRRAEAAVRVHGGAGRGKSRLQFRNRAGRDDRNPAAVMVADLLAAEARFFSIGTNDLTQYVMAADRGNPRVAHLCDPSDTAVRRSVAMTLAAARSAGIEAGMCGELAADPEATAWLLEAGLEKFSVSAPAVAPLKERIRTLDLPEVRKTPGAAE